MYLCACMHLLRVCVCGRGHPHPHSAQEEFFRLVELAEEQRLEEANEETIQREAQQMRKCP